MNKINEIKLPEGVDRISVKQHDDKIVIEFIPEEPKFKRGDILKATTTPELIVIFDKMASITAFDSIYNNGENSNDYWSLKNFRHATKEEKQEFFDELEVKGKRWNDDKKCIEDIQKRKFKVGDKVRIKDGISSETHNVAGPGFNRTMDEFIGKELTVEEYSSIEWVVFYEDDYRYQFAENWLEPYTEEPKKGDLAIFWDNSKDIAIMRTYREKKGMLHYDSVGYPWKNAIKFESKEQFEKVLRGEI